ncbi:arsinothricin resistance N-acetyltransferase ArsN1 family B [Sphingobium sp. CCH11-B1]|jgi:phosphinothricin acetyltransferase|uniref:arsinothricin resistance N-acetyltransferase ArsN1 family B n=1 Tax=Sphingobium sp. CCH11-B1 TaxID=1768781 RepID=UPI0008371A70|nr:arsinothricin resistance N-acetyltransferase ArsN1 family B [Sphingobium sp. CCH11-B1]MEA3390833.1 arsinothricin resistance N-acetyltransferase ArsN1 family B [Pseudomonadota bacterium]
MLTVRRADAADAAACAAIYAPFVTDSWVSFETDPPDPAEMARRIADHGASHGWLVALEPDGAIVGYAYGSPHRARAAYATSADVAIYVDPAFARRGVGVALYAALLPMLKARGCHAAFAGIALPNAASIALHEAMGFTPVGIYREVGWKLDGWRDVGWWQRLL